MVLDKTGGLFRLAVRVMQAFSTNKTDYIPLVNSLGLFFQIQDDYMNLQSEEYANNKSFCEDLTEGKYVDGSRFSRSLTAPLFLQGSLGDVWSLRCF